MDAVYPFHKPATCWGEEIQYSIKSLRKFTTIDKVYTVGDSAPNTINIPYKQTQQPSVNIWEKCLEACKDPRVSDPFLFLSDDHYFLTPQDIENYPNYCHGTLAQYPFLNKIVEVNGKKFDHPYWGLVTKTFKLLGDVTFFNVHCPAVVHKDRLYECYRKYQDELYQGLGLLFKTTYLQGLPGVEMTDYKTRDGTSLDEVRFQTRHRHVFSSNDEISEGVKKFLQSLFD